MDAQEIIEVRKRAGLSTLELSRHLQVPQTLVLQWEAGERFPTKRHCQQLKALAAVKTPAD